MLQFINLYKKIDYLLEKIGKSVKTIEEMIGKRRSLTDKIVLGWQKGLWKKKLIINHLDSMRGLKYLENAAKDIGVKTNTINGAWKTTLKVRPEQDWTDLKGRAVVDETD